MLDTGSALTHLHPGAWPGRPYGDFAGKEVQVIAEEDQRGGMSMSAREMRRCERQQLLEMLRQDEEAILPILVQLVRRR